MLSIRKCRNPNDVALATIRRIEEACGLPPSKEPSTWWLAWDGDEPVAYAGMVLYPDIGKPGGFLSRCGVLPCARGQGLQRRLIRVREREIVRCGYDRAFTYTSRDNYASANNLIACGYRLYHPPFLWGLRDGLYFEKVL